MIRSFFATLIFAAAASAQIVSMTIVAPAFTGSGLNDATAGGSFVGLRANHQYTAAIAATGSTDTVNFSRDGGTAIGPYAMTGVAQPLYYPAGNVSAASWTGGVATYTDTAHGLTSGALVTVVSAAPSGYNVAACSVMVVDANHFSCPITANPGSYSSGGVVEASDGLTITWAAITGHSAGAVWTVSVNGVASPPEFLAQGVGAAVRSQEDKLRDFISVLDFAGVLCNGSHDDTAGIQAALNSGSSVYVPNLPLGKACMISAPLYTARAGQIFWGIGSGFYNGLTGAMPGQSVLRALPSFSGPSMFVVMHQGARVDDLQLDANGYATSGLTMFCGSGSLINKIFEHGATGAGLLFTNTWSPSIANSDCGTGTGVTGNNDAMKVSDSTFFANAGAGITFTANAGDVNNNAIQLDTDRAQNNGLDGIWVRNANKTHIHGGDYSYNGDTSSSSQNYCIHNGGTSDPAVAESTIIDGNITFEACNLQNGVTSRGPNVLFDIESVQSSLYIDGNASDYGNAAGKEVYFAGQGCWIFSTYISGWSQMCAGGTSGDPEYSWYVTSFSTTEPVFQITDSSQGWLPRFPPLANSNDELLSADTNGRINLVPQGEVAWNPATIAAGANIPVGPTVIYTAGGGYLNSGPTLKQTYVIIDTSGVANNIFGNGKNIGSAGTTWPFPAYGVLGITYDGTQWRVMFSTPVGANTTESFLSGCSLSGFGSTSGTACTNAGCTTTGSFITAVTSATLSCSTGSATFVNGLHQ